MNKNTTITLLVIMVAVLAIVLFNAYQHNEKVNYELSKSMEEIKLKLNEVGDKIENKTHKIKQDLDETGNKIENKANKIKNDLKE